MLRAFLKWLGYVPEAELLASERERLNAVNELTYLTERRVTLAAMVGRTRQLELEKVKLEERSFALQEELERIGNLLIVTSGRLDAKTFKEVLERIHSLEETP